MTWVKLDDQFFRNPKVRAAGKDGRELYIAGLCHCAAQLTDGRIDKAIVPVLAAEAEVKPAAAQRLVTLDLWSDDGDAYIVHDYLAWNPSAEAVHARRAQRADAGKRGGKRSGESRRSKPEANNEASASANGQRNGSGNSSKHEADANPGPGPGPGPLTDVSEGLPPVTDLRPGVSSPEGRASLIGHYRSSYRGTHDGIEPVRHWSDRLEAQLDDYAMVPYADMELIVGTIAREGKDPKHLPLVVSDFYKDRQAGAV